MPSGSLTSTTRLIYNSLRKDAIRLHDQVGHPGEPGRVLAAPPAPEWSVDRIGAYLQ
jgi:hypothetical protein